MGDGDENSSADRVGTRDSIGGQTRADDGDSGGDEVTCAIN